MCGRKLLGSAARRPPCAGFVERSSRARLSRLRSSFLIGPRFLERFEDAAERTLRLVPARIDERLFVDFDISLDVRFKAGRRRSPA